jgi:pimeloyl-ACP methyl ester carboxylesterase
MTALDKEIQVWGGAITATVATAGEGPPLVYMHGAGGLIWNESLERLAEDFTVYAPYLPGTGEGNPTAIYSLASLQDLLLFYFDVLDALELVSPVVVGESFGGMLAAELAATNPSAIGPLVLFSPLGLWRDDAPVPNWTIMTDDELRRTMFHDPQGSAADAFFAPHLDPEAQAAAALRATWAQACSAKFLWPIPERGLRNRLHRIKSRTLVVWGESDQLVSPVYARDFTESIQGARLEMVSEAGHLVQLEQPDAFDRLVKTFVSLPAT